MCGLVGVIGNNLPVKFEQAFKTLLYIDTIRGPDSTGVLRIDARHKTDIFKNVGTPWDLFQTVNGSRMLSVMSHMYMGHNRLATKGRVTRLNAHPFEQGNIIGAHNGTLTTRYMLLDHDLFEVDSENIFHSINKIGVKETISELRGAYALTWWNKEDNTFNLIRNKERPLYTAYVKDSHILLWASEAFMLGVVAHRCEIELEKIKAVPIDTLHTFKIPTRDKAIEAPVLEKIEGHSGTIVFENWIDQYRGYKSGKDKNKQQSHLALVQGKLNKPDPDFRIDGYGIERLTFEEFKKRTKEVCVVCDGDIEYLDKNLFWLNERTCVCKECTKMTEDGEQFLDFTEINRWM